MDIAERHVYNLPGFGLMKVRLFPHSRRVFDFLEYYEHVSRLKQIDQLGSIRDVLPGAHHTRYEYLMAQLALISELCNLTGPLPDGMSVSSERDTFGRLPGLGKDPSGAELLQVLALLGNIGHLPSTFAGERAFLKYLADNRDARKAFRDGLPQSALAGFDEVVVRRDVYAVNAHVALFLLNRYRRRADGHEVVDFCQSILMSYLSSDPDGDDGLCALWRLYGSIRHLTYMALDSHYAPVPFSLDLASIFFNLQDYLAQLFIQGSPFQDALSRLEGVMQDTVYLAPKALLNHARVSDGVLTRLETTPPSNTIAGLWRELSKTEPWLMSSTSGDLDLAADAPTVSLTYEVKSGSARALLVDALGWEREAQSSIGLRSCRLGAECDPYDRELRVAASIRPGQEPSLRLRTALRASKQLIDLDLAAREHCYANTMFSNGRSILRFLLEAAFGEAYDYRLTAKQASNASAFALGRGSTQMSRQVESYHLVCSGDGLLGADELNEIDMLKETLKGISYRGNLIAFAGSTTVLKEGKQIAEFDGVVFLLSREADEPTLLLVEAKNKLNGHLEAAAQLKDRIDRLGGTEADFDIEHLGNKGAYARVTLPLGG